MVTVVTMILGVGAVPKRPSPSSQPSRGSRPQTAGAKPPFHPVGRKGAFDGRQAVKSAFALLLTKVTKPAAGAAKGGLD